MVFLDASSVGSNEIRSAPVNFSGLMTTESLQILNKMDSFLEDVIDILSLCSHISSCPTRC